MAFTDRWQIDGLLTTESPLHVGSGGTIERPDLRRDTLTDDEGPIQISAVATDHQGRAYIPGTTLKGDLLAWAEAHGLRDELKDVFGWYLADTREGRGGSAEFRDAHAIGGAPPAHTPYWSAERLTGVAASVAISRATHTASDKKLFHQEYVPAAVPFNVTITGRMTEAQVKALLTLLEIPGLTLGASTGNGWGRVSWTLQKIRRLDAEGVRAWLAAPTHVGYQALRDLPRETMTKWAAEVATRARTLTQAGRTPIVLDLELSFDGRFLVNDTSQTRKDEDDHAPDAPKKPDHAPRRDAKGRAYLPASSFRGALRSQAERILRTRGDERAACSPDKPCEAVEDRTAVRASCPACRVFGASGWRAPIDVSDFVAALDVDEATQDFLAIDRFTGGGSNHLKFDARAAVRPVLKGRVSVDAAALAWAGAWPWALGLLALVLRDLVEGDVRFGFGSAKGYGGCHARITRVDVLEPERWSPELRSAAGLDPTHWPKSGPPTTAPTADSPLGHALDAWVKLIPTGA